MIGRSSPWVRLPMLLAALLIGILLATACSSQGLPPDERLGYRRTPLPDVSQIHLVDYSSDPGGEPFLPVAAVDDVLLVFFGYLSCPDVCPTTLAEVSNAIAAMPPSLAERIAVAMVSVDPERDSGSEIAAYLDAFVHRHHALLASNAARLDAAAAQFGVVYEIEDHPMGSTTYDVGHSATLYVVDDTGTVVWEIGFGGGRDPDLLAATLENLLHETYG